MINIKENWDAEGQIADQSAMTAGDGYMELPLTDDLRNRLANAGHWMIQFNKEAGAPFNVTDIVLVLKSDGPTTAVEYTAATIQCQKVMENGQVLIIRDGKTFNLFGAEVR